jgi:hypothetical protein
MFAPWFLNDTLFQYIEKVVRDRSPLYDGSAPPIFSIDVVENGVLLRKDLHRLLGDAEVAFIKV